MRELRRPLRSAHLASTDVGGCGRRDHRVSGEVQVEAKHPLPAGARHGPALSGAIDPGYRRPLALPERHVRRPAGQAEGGRGHRSRRRDGASRQGPAHPKGGLDRASARCEGDPPGGDARHGEGSLGGSGPGRKPRQGSRVPRRVAIPLDQGAGSGKHPAPRRVHQFVPGDRLRPVVEPVERRGGGRSLRDVGTDPRGFVSSLQVLRGIETVPGPILERQRGARREDHGRNCVSTIHHEVRGGVAVERPMLVADRPEPPVNRVPKPLSRPVARVVQAQAAPGEPPQRDGGTRRVRRSVAARVGAGQVARAVAPAVLIRIGHRVADERVARGRERRLGAARGVGRAGRRLDPLDGHQPGPQGEGEDEHEEGGAALPVGRRPGSTPSIRSGRGSRPPGFLTLATLGFIRTRSSSIWPGRARNGAASRGSADPRRDRPCAGEPAPAAGPRPRRGRGLNSGRRSANP